MDRDDKDNANGPLTDGEREPPKSSFIKARGRTKSPPWNRVVVLDCDRNTVEVKNKVDLGPIEEYQRVKLPSGLSQVTIFLDSKTVTTTTKESTPDGDSNVKLAKIYLNKLGFSNSLLRYLGQLSTLYVKKIKPWSETSSFASSPHSVGGVAT